MRVAGSDEEPTAFPSVHAAYLSLGPGARVLKTWKTTRNPALERWLRSGLRRALAPFETARKLVLVPIPQSAERRWELHGGSTLRLCEMIVSVRRQGLLATEIRELLAPAPVSEPSQAKTRGSERYRRKASFMTADGVPPLAPGEAAVVVDDLLTSGSTVRAALRALRRPLPVLVLGFRPALSDSPSSREGSYR
jgi:predicted amidophosphoribosyltransferase